MSKLVICEKPSVAKSIASALGVTSRADGYFEGGGWLISWCIGHLVGLADAAAYDDRYKKWRYEDLPILPDPFRYVVSEEKLRDRVRELCPDCKIALMVDSNTERQAAKDIRDAKKNGLIDQFFYGSMTAEYLMDQIYAM